LRQCKGDAKQILLGLKKLGLGMGKLNGFGGKVKAGESIEEAAVRELYEETGVMATPRDITKVGEMAFFFPAVPEEEGWNQRMHIFFANEWEGEPVETDEMRPEWVDINNIPFDRMWADDRHWLPLILINKLVKGSFVFNGDNESIRHFVLDEVEGFD